MKSVITMFDIPNIITADYYNCIDPFSREGIWQLCYRDLTNNKIALNSLSELSELCFNTGTTFPSEWEAQASTVLEDGKSNLINSGKLTGKGVKVAVIDRPINKNHIEFQNRIEYIEVLPDIPETKRTDFHGIACASFLSGATCGVATESKLVYFAIPNKTSPIYDYYNYQLIALQKVIDYNKTNQEPIRIVSLSAPFTNEQKPTRDFLECELKKTGCTLIDATSFGHNFYGVDYVRCQEKGEFLLNQWQIDNYESKKTEKDLQIISTHCVLYLLQDAHQRTITLITVIYIGVNMYQKVGQFRMWQEHTHCAWRCIPICRLRILLSFPNYVQSITTLRY